jgi:hypothetical protein
MKRESGESPERIRHCKGSLYNKPLRYYILGRVYRWRTKPGELLICLVDSSYGILRELCISHINLLYDLRWNWVSNLLDDL